MGRKALRYAKRAAVQRYMRPGGAMRLYKDVKYIKSVLNTELKYVDGVQTTATSIPFVGAPGGSWLLYRMNNVAQGPGVSERNGSSVKFTSIQIKGNLERTAGSHRCRIVLFVDRENLASGVGVNPLWSDVYATVSGNGTLDAMRSFNSILEKRFKVLYDRTYKLDTEVVQKPFSIYKKLNMVTKWQVQSSGSNAQINNVLYLAIMTDDPAGTATNATHYSRACFRDN